MGLKVRKGLGKRLAEEPEESMREDPLDRKRALHSSPISFSGPSSSAFKMLSGGTSLMVQ